MDRNQAEIMEYPPGYNPGADGEGGKRRPIIDRRVSVKKETKWGSRPIGNEGWKLFNQILTAIDGVSFKVDKIKLQKGQKNTLPYRINKSEQKKQFPRGEKDSGESEMIKTDNIQVVIDPERFTYTDVPHLIRAIEEEYNNFLESIGIQEKSQFLKACRNIFRRWKRVADYLENFPQDKISDKAVKQELSNVAQVILNIAQSFQNKEKAPEEFPQEETEDTYVEKIFLPKLEALLTKRNRQANNTTKRTEAIKKLVRRGLRDQLEREMEEIVFQREVVETIRQSDLTKEMKKAVEGFLVTQNYDIVTLMEFLRLTPTEQETLDTLQQELFQARESGNNQTEAKAEIKIAKWINVVIYSERYWSYAEGKYAFTDIAKREVDCMTLGLLQYILIKALIDKEVLGARTDLHFFTILPTANGQFWALDGNVWPIMQKQKDGNWQNLRSNKIFYGPGKTNYRKFNDPNNRLIWFTLGRFTDVYMADVYNQHLDTAKNLTAVEYFLNQALRLGSQNPDCHINYGIVLKKMGRYNEAEGQYKIAIAKDPENPDYLDAYDDLLDEMD